MTEDDFEDCSVLMIDDEPFAQDLIAHSLRDFSRLCLRYEANPARAVAVAVEVGATVILVDLRMPGIDGFGVIDTDMQGQIRATSLAHFPLRQRFDALKQSGELAAPPRVARQLLDFMLSKDFGRDPVADLRQLKAVRK